MTPYPEIDFQPFAEEPQVAYEANRELNLAWRIVEETGANLFLTGRAGTGKTTFLRKLRETTSKRMVVLAPTGVAAINAQGNTIHSFFQLPFAPYVPGKGFLSADKKFFRFSKLKRRIISAMSLLVIDEVSMVRPDILDAIDMILRRFRNPTKPFGGVQLLLIGDLRQLPPVLKETEWQHLEPYYSSPYFFDSIALKQAGYQAIELTTVYRQSDREFISILNAIRDGKADMDILRLLNTRYIPGFNPGEDEGYIRLTTHNHIANDYNARKLAELPAQPFTYEAEVSGEFPESNFPIDRQLVLKEGAQVMFVKNDTGAYRRYYNGLIGTVTALSDSSITVMPRNGGDSIEVERVDWENTRYAVNEESKEIVQETIGTFNQFPLKTAWSITIHKSQGLTFDKAIIDAALSFAPGQTYVALSRCRSLEGMVLGSPIPANAIITDHEVNSFISYCESHSPDLGTLQALRSEYLRMLLADLFDFSPLRIALADFIRNVNDYIVPLYPSLGAECFEANGVMSEKIYEVGRKFVSLYASAPVDPEKFDADMALKERIRRGCLYFLDHLKMIARFVNRVPRDIDNQAYIERLNNAFDALWFQLQVKIHMMTTLSEREFSTAAYTNARAEALIDVEGGKKPKQLLPTAGKPVSSVTDSPGSGAPRRFRKEKEKKEAKPKGYSVHETLRLFREGKSIEDIARERGLKESTVSGHLADAVNEGNLPLEDLMELPLLKEIKKAIMRRGEKSYEEVREELQALHPDKPLPLHLLYFANKVRTKNVQ